MKIKWLGHSCFLFTTEDNIRIITDPFDEKVGYKIPQEEADIVTASHSHSDHNYLEAIKGDYVAIREPGKHKVKGININGISLFHDERHGEKRGKNIVYTFDIDGLRICHCGDLGHLLSDKHIDEIGKVDVLLIPVGGTYTIDAQGAYEVVSQLKPKITIPMHFKTEATSFPIETVDSFLTLVGNGERLNKQELTLNKKSLDDLPKTIVLDYSSN